LDLRGEERDEKAEVTRESAEKKRGVGRTHDGNAAPSAATELTQHQQVLLFGTTCLVRHRLLSFYSLSLSLSLSLFHSLLAGSKKLLAAVGCLCRLLRAQRWLLSAAGQPAKGGWLHSEGRAKKWGRPPPLPPPPAPPAPTLK
jgi:hypothetical protein